MPEGLALPTVVAELQRRTALEASGPSDLYQVIRAMQRLGLPKVDIEVHIERIRAANSATENSDVVEHNCLMALEMAIGEAGSMSLSWEHQEMATIYVPRVVNEQLAASNLEFALEPSDLLPPRPARGDLATAVRHLPSRLVSQLDAENWSPHLGDEFRVPKSAFTTRPASLLALPDRLVFESLAGVVESSLDHALPSAVVWPRRRGTRPDASTFRAIPAQWDAPYVVKIDIAGFYEAVDHSLLAMILAGRLDCHSNVTQAIEHFLGAVMGRPVGLPQGPPASDVLASTYLLLIDDRLTSEGWSYSRFADDYFLAANSMADGRRKIETIERFLGEHHLRLNETKTTIMRQETYMAGLQAPPPTLARLTAEIRKDRADYLVASQDQEEIAEMLSSAGADEQLLFDVLYHGTMTIEEAIAELGKGLDPDAASLRLVYLRRVDAELAAGEVSDEMSTIADVVRDCVAFMAAAQETDAIDVVERLLSWFPSIGPVASLYFDAVSADAPDAVDASLTRLLTPFELPDWTAAWLCRTVERRAGTVQQPLMAQLEVLAANEDFRPLTRATATWALASKNALTAETWTAAFADASGPIRAELLLAMQSSPELYPPPTGATDDAKAIEPNR